MVDTSSCIFCSVINKKIGAKIVAENSSVLAFHDINPVADIHILIIPKIHIRGVNNLSPEHASVVGDMCMMAQELAKRFQLEASGYRLVINTESGAGQSVFHIHMHFLAGCEFSWPPGVSLLGHLS